MGDWASFGVRKGPNTRFYEKHKFSIFLAPSRETFWGSPIKILRVCEMIGPSLGPAYCLGPTTAGWGPSGWVYQAHAGTMCGKFAVILVP